MMTSNPSQTIRVGAISFVNTIPIYSDYQPVPGSDLIYDVPANLNGKIRAGLLEISPVSSACYIREQEQLVLLDNLSVSSYGSVESVIFLSRVPMDTALLDAGTIYVPNDSETSVMLLAYLLREATGQDLRPWFQIYEAPDYEKTLKTGGNALVIGDNALMLQEMIQRGELEGFYCYDLSTLWKEKTGLPFVFAVWVANRNWAETNPISLSDINQALTSSRHRFFNNPTTQESGLSQAQTKSKLPRSTLQRYYHQCLNYEFNEEHRQSLALFATIIQESSQWESLCNEHQPSP